MADRFECEGVGSTRDEAIEDARQKAERFYGEDEFHELIPSRGTFSISEKTYKGARTEYRALFQFSSGPKKAGRVTVIPG